MAHTPGPWRLYNDEVRKEPFTENGERLIARVHRWQEWETSDEMWANGRLIAAAPDLLEACEWALADALADYDEGHETVVLLRAAIQKAKEG